MFIPRDFIENLISRTDIIDIIQERVQLKKAGKNFVACCPFHQEKTPSFNVNQAKQFYHCFGCGVSGNVISFLLDFDRMSFVDAIEFLAQRAGLEVPQDKNPDSTKRSVASKLDDYELLESVSKFYQQQLRSSSIAIDYLKSRGITGQTAKHFGVGFAPDSWDALLREFKEAQKLFDVGMIIAKDNESGFYDRYRNRIMFPIRNTRGQIIGFGGRVLDQSLPKYLNSPETHLFQKSHELYGWHEALQSSRKLNQVFVVEGYLDVMSLHQAGVTESVATLGTATSSEHVQKISRQTNHIIFCFDGDKAGREAAWRALINALPVLKDGLEISFLFLPDGEDPDSYVRKNSAEAFRELAKNATPLSEYFFKQLSLDCNLQQAEGRSRLVKNAIPLLTKIPPTAFLGMLCNELGNLSKYEQSAIQKLLRDSRSKSSDEIGEITENITHQYRVQLTPMRMAVSLLLQNPQLAQSESVNKIYNLDKQNGIELLQQLCQECKQNPEVSTAIILELWRNKPEFSALLKLAALEHELPNTAMVVQAWEDSLTRIFEQVKQNQMSMLLDKMKSGEMNETERTQLLDLVGRA